MKRTTAISIFFLVPFFSAACADEVSDALSATPTATIANGRIIGTTTSVAGSTATAAVNKFLGIPYAAAPTGDARFEPPQAHANWNTLGTKELPNSCIQVFSPTRIAPFTEAVFNNPPPKNESEDCLYLNVFAPKKAWDINAPPYPVMYWMYGGGWKFGYSGLQIYDGSHFAGLEDVVLVTVNYRTNAFGLPQTSAIANITERNLALLDQRAGLQWVQDNIHHFGGDKSKVTIFGQSAGAYATDTMVTSYSRDDAPPFHAAIMESGVYAYNLAAYCSNTDYSAWGLLVSALNCNTGTTEDQFNCVKYNRTAEQIRDAQDNNSNIGFAFACDNTTIVSDPRTRLEAGNVANVPVVLGTNTAEGSFYTSFYDNFTDVWFSDTFASYGAALPAFENRVLAAYPLGVDGRIDNQTRLAQIYTDVNFHCPAVWYANTSSLYKDTYRYLFNATFENTRVQWPDWDVRYQGAYHTSEIPIVFTSYNMTSTSDAAAERTLSDTMRHAWANFARDPTTAPIQGWVKVQNGDSSLVDVMEFGIDGKAQRGMVADGKICDFWVSEGYRTARS
ncbi:alpha/beta-hydrolase [Lophiostoma macrostomum CBS 122681]|uniref:Carboxylic ester hydrolase n=1 Tax=Lophiostoma macrostomum CBS 122681 TaxID=1314788 RepID=A0A6A6SK42_9PLEO|nr:alpha/beta-hydrolase [Lophiostoma macrostomum CBS 122681]